MRKLTENIDKVIATKEGVLVFSVHPVYYNYILY